MPSSLSIADIETGSIRLSQLHMMTQPPHSKAGRHEDPALSLALRHAAFNNLLEVQKLLVANYDFSLRPKFAVATIDGISFTAAKPSCSIRWAHDISCVPSVVALNLRSFFIDMRGSINVRLGSLPRFSFVLRVKGPQRRSL